MAFLMTNYFIWRCPECGAQASQGTDTRQDPLCYEEAHDGRDRPVMEKIPVLTIEDSLTDEMVERAADTMSAAYMPDEGDDLEACWNAAVRAALLAAGPRSGIEFTEGEREALLMLGTAFPGLNKDECAALLSARAKLEKVNA